MSTDSASSPMPVDLPSVSKVYQDQLTTLSHGLALWNPNPPKEIYDKVSIGDVGYLHEGSFIRMFNVMLPWSHESNRTLGEPEPYESLDCGPFANTLKRQFDRVKHCSRYVSETNAGNRQAMMIPDDVESATYRFQNRGTLLSLPNGGHHEDVIRAQVFEDYIQDYVDSWFTWAQKNRLGVERVEDLILVSGCTLVTSWAAAAFVDDSMDAEISLASRTLNNGGASFVWSNIRGRVLYHNSRFEPFHGEQNSTMTQDQCVFIRGFRVKDDKMQVIRVSCVPEYDDPNVGVVDTIRPPIKNENPRRSSYRHPTKDGLRNSWYITENVDPLIGSSSSSLDTIRPPIHHENPQLFPYSSSTTLQSNGGRCNASFMTSPSYNSSFEVLNYFAEIRDEDAFAEDTTSITHDNDLPLVDNVKSLTVDAEENLRENNTSLLKTNSPAILRDPPETDRMITKRKKGRFRRVLQMSKVDKTHFKTLDRRSTILLQATRKQTEAEEKSLSRIEDPGIDALRGSFGTVGSIIRARSARRINQSSHSTGQSSRFGYPTSSLVDVERGDFESSPFATNLDHYGSMKRHQLFDPPVSHLDVPESDVSLSSQPSARKPAIRFDEQDIVHSYHRGTLGKDDMARHERRPPETDQTITERKEGRSGRVLQMSKVDPSNFKTLDRRSTVVLKATQKQTEAVEEKSLSGVEEPGIDALRGSFGTVGSIIRARSAHRINQSSHSTGQSSPFGSPSSLVDVERGDFESSPFATNLGHYGGMKRHQLFDPPVPHLDVPESDAISLSSQPSARKTAIKFGERDVIHSYHRGTLGKDDMAPHERRAAPHSSSPLAATRSLVQPSFLPEGSNGSQQQQQQSPVTTGSGSPPRFGLGLDEPRSAPAGVGVAGGAYRDPFEGAPASVAFPAIPWITSLDDDVETRRHNRRTYSRQGSPPKGDGADDAEERVSLWDPRREYNEETDATSSPESLYGSGNIRLVGSSRAGRF